LILSHKKLKREKCYFENSVLLIRLYFDNIVLLVLLFIFLLDKQLFKLPFRRFIKIKIYKQPLSNVKILQGVYDKCIN